MKDKPYIPRGVGQYLRDMAIKANPAIEKLTMAKIECTDGKQTDLERLFMMQMKAVKIPMPQCQVAFHPTRKFIWDFVWPSIKFWVEIDGGEWMARSGHTSGRGMTRDREKDAEAFLLGYRGMRFTGSMVKDGTAIKYLETALDRGLFNGKLS